MIAVDVSGTNTTAALCGHGKDGRFLTEVVCSPRTPRYPGHGKTFSQYLAEDLVPCVIRSLVACADRCESGERLPIAVSFSGQVGRGGEICSASSIFGKHRASPPLDLHEAIANEPKLRNRDVYVLNNVTAAAWRLSTEPQTAEADRFLVLHVGSGFGSKVFDRQLMDVLMDAAGLAGELGHASVKRPGIMPYPVPCDCGANDHLASFVLRPGLRRLLARILPDVSLDGTKETNPPGSDTFARALANPATVGKAMEVLDIAAGLLGEVVSHVVLSIGIDKVVLKGGLYPSLGPHALAHVIRSFRKDIQRRIGNYIPIPDEFVVDYARGLTARTTGAESERADRVLSLEGLLTYAEHHVATGPGVSAGHSLRCPAFQLSTVNDMRYSVARNDGLLDPKDHQLADLSASRKVLLVLDKEYDNLHGHELERRLHTYFRAHGRATTASHEGAAADRADVVIRRLAPSVTDARSKRENKGVESLHQVIDWARLMHLPRNGLLVAVGGGVILDIVGFAAQQFRRRIDYIRIPTTLVGQVDAGVGVKVGVNYKDDKNLIGAFYAPHYVINCMEFLYDLPANQLACGLAEIMKMGIACQFDILGNLEWVARRAKRHGAMTGDILRRDPALHERFKRLIDDAVVAMLRQLQTNPVETGLLRLVDFGHTFSPTIEALSDYSVPHGYAVAVDMALSCFMANALESASGSPLLPNPLLDRYKTLAADLGILIYPHVMGSDLLEKHGKDIFDCSVHRAVDHRGENLNMVIPTDTPGAAGFVNLEECDNGTAPYAAIVSRGELRQHFQNAAAWLKQAGQRKDF